jgi:hypothetical protein
VSSPPPRPGRHLPACGDQVKGRCRHAVGRTDLGDISSSAMHRYGETGLASEPAGDENPPALSGILLGYQNRSRLRWTGSPPGAPTPR